MANGFILFNWTQYPFKNICAISYTKQNEVALEIVSFLACHLEGKFADIFFTNIEY